MKRLQIQKWLYLFILLGPILDNLTGISQTFLHMNLGVTIIIRLIIPLFFLGYGLFKDKSVQKQWFILGVIYLIYAGLHMFYFMKYHNAFFEGTFKMELQYVINYTYLIFTMLLFNHHFKEGDNQLSQSIFYANLIALATIMFAMITRTSFETYASGGGYKGYYYSGGALGAFLTISLFIILPYIYKTFKQQVYLKIAYMILTPIYLVFFIGTRVGLLGVILAFASMAFATIFVGVVGQGKIKKQTVIISLVITATLATGVIVFGSQALNRRKVLDNETHETIHLDLDLNDIITSIENGEANMDDFNDTQVKALFALREEANRRQLPNTDYRMQQFIFQYNLWKYQSDPGLYLFGNGFLNAFRILILEMELFVWIFNFGIVGFILYGLPFIWIIILGIYFGIRHIKKISTEYVMYLLGALYTLAISTLSGRVYFHATAIPVIIVIHVLLLKEIRALRKVD